MEIHGNLRAVILPVSPFRQNCALLFEEIGRRGVLIDPGAELPRIEAAIAKRNIKIEAIWLTHCHIDHAGAAYAAAQKLGVEIYGSHKDDKILLDCLEQTAAYYNWPEQVRNFTPQHWLKEGDSVACGSHIFNVLHTPGHAPGHVVYYCAAEKLVFVGDVLFRGSVGRTDLPNSNPADLRISLREKLLPLGDDVAFICGHGRGSKIGHERRTNPFLQGL